MYLKKDYFIITAYKTSDFEQCVNKCYSKKDEVVFYGLLQVSVIQNFRLKVRSEVTLTTVSCTFVHQYFEINPYQYSNEL